MNHLMQESYIGDSLQHVLLGEFITGEELLIGGSRDRLFLYRIQEGHLVKIKEKRLFGCILGIELVREGGCDKSSDGILVHFEYARTSNVYFSESENDFVCTVLRCYEKQEYGFVSTTEKIPSFLRTDMHHDISFLLISKTHFVIFNTSEPKRARVDRVNTIRPKHCVMKDARFLNGFTSPTICFLFEDTMADKCKAAVYVVDEEEKELSLFFEIESIPHGCFEIVPTEEKAFMVLGANGAIFYTQWEMVGVRFNDFWSIAQMGIDERPLAGPHFVLDQALCLTKGRNLFVFAETGFLRFTILGTEGRVRSLHAERMDLPGIEPDRQFSGYTGQNQCVVSTARGLYLFDLVRTETFPDDSNTQEVLTVADEFKKTFLDILDEFPTSSSDQPSSQENNSPRGSSTKDSTLLSISAKDEERIYQEIFGTTIEETPPQLYQSTQGIFTHTLRLSLSKPTIGEVHSITPMLYTDKKKEYLISGGTAQHPLLIEGREGIELLFTETSRIKGYADMFLVSAINKTYLVTKEKESTIVCWHESIDIVESGVHAEEYTLELFATATGYAQVTERAIVYLKPSLAKEKEVSIPEAHTAFISDGLIFIITKTGDMLSYRGLRKSIIPLKNIQAATVHNGRLFAIDYSGCFFIFSLAAKQVLFVSPVLSLFPAVIEDATNLPQMAGLAKQAATHAATVVEIAALQISDSPASSFYLILRTNHNEVVVYKESNKGTFFLERISNIQLYYERTLFAEETKRKKMRICRDLLFIPGQAYTRVLAFTKEGLFMHRCHTPIESISEYPHDDKRMFTILAKGNLARGFLPPFKYDKSLLYQITPIESICETIVHCPTRKIVIASSYQEIDYTPEMVPFTVLATTEVDSTPLPTPTISPIEIKPKTRAYSLKIFSLEEMKTCKAGDVLRSVDTFNLEENEYVASHKILTLPDKQSTTGFSDFSVVCTTFVTDEDLISTGRLLVLEIASVVPERNRKETKHKLKLLAAEKTKGAATACAEICGSIAVCVGTKLMVYAFERNEGLKAVAFHDMQVFLTSCAVLRNILVCGDAYKGVFLFFYQREPPLLHMLSQSTGTVYLLRGVSMSLLHESCALLSYDSIRHVYMYSYSPQNILSQKGTRLISRAECHLPDEAVGSFMVDCLGHNYQTIIYTKHGYIYKHRMLDQNRYSSLLDLQHSILTQIRSSLGTNPAAHWISDKPGEMRDITLKEVLQSSIAEEYFYMSRVRQARASSTAGRDSSGAVKLELLVYRQG
ncbi:cleavage and polyadenylation specificity factor subunit 1 [Nematocida homosporus]|uniref:cleavage and polyadenylation specificity factor subunit 1 n=1 Tax=Nematocida homosporus TaxID=1912981 RepID=UPI00221F7E1C|nr:cleavage and polyadenylation specificity factor subunit 1 [Nematocida homosporus]KAI5185643.1 cleavage and polyadenylation specificity factor subunit 1 [Nematocida homosporus]